MVLANESPNTALNRPRRVLATLGIVVFALPLLLLQVVGQTEDGRRVREIPESGPPAPATPHSSDLDDLPEDLRQAQEQLGWRFLERAAEVYRAGDQRRFRSYLRKARELGGLGDEVHPLSGTMGVLSIGPARVEDQPLLESIGKKGKPAAPFKLMCIEKRFGKLEREKPGYWVDGPEGLLVQELRLLNEIAQSFGESPERKKTVRLQFRLLQIDSKEAEKWSRTLTGSVTDDQFQHALSTDQKNRLQNLVESRTAGVKTVSAPRVTQRDGQTAHVLIFSQRAYIKSYELISKGKRTVADPVVGVLSDGLVVESLPIVEERSGVRLFLRPTFVKLKELKEVEVVLGPFAGPVPIGFPNLERETGFYEALVPDGKDLLLGRLPTATEKSFEETELHWLWVQTSVTEPSDE